MTIPASVRAQLPRRDPARAVSCPHCRAEPPGPCVTPGRGTRLGTVHPARATAWADQQGDRP